MDNSTLITLKDNCRTKRDNGELATPICLDTFWSIDLLHNREQKKDIRRMFIQWVSNDWKGDFSKSQKFIIDDGEGKIFHLLVMARK